MQQHRMTWEILFEFADVRDKEPNLKQAIDAYQEALKTYTVEIYPIGYATTQTNLGIALGNWL